MGTDKFFNLLLKIILSVISSFAMFSRIAGQRHCLNCIRTLQKNMSSENTGTQMTKPDHINLTAQQTREPDVLDAKITRISDLSKTVKGYRLHLTSRQHLKLDNGLTFSFPMLI